MPDAQAVGQRCVDQLAFLRHLLAHRAGPVVEEAQGLHAARQAQQDDADVIDHGQQHLAQDLGLRLDSGHAFGRRSARQRAQAAKAVQAGNQSGHRIAIADFQAPGAILDMVAGRKQQGGDAGIGIEVERSDDQGHAQGVLQYRLSGTEQLFAVGFARQCQGVDNAPCRRVGHAQTQLRQCGSLAIGLLQGMHHGDHGRIIPCGTLRPWPPSRADQATVPEYRPRRTRTGT
jgi:hypothetical protein